MDSDNGYGAAWRTCPDCGNVYVLQHYCKALQKQQSAEGGCKPAPPLTEQDVRRIVRDEMKLAGLLK